MCAIKLTAFIFCCLALFQFSFAHQPELSVGEIDVSPLQWGEQTAVFEVTNNANNVKYLTVETEVQFTGSYLNPNRHTRSHYVLEPLESRIFTTAVYIPGNYGRAEVIISFYDVVDTLDILMPGQKFFEKPFSVTFNIPDEILPYLTEEITLMPMVEPHPDFDNEFARVVLILLGEGRTVEEIAAMAMADISFVHEVVQSLVDKGYARKKNVSYRSTFPTQLSHAQQPELFVGEINFSSLRWGKQTAVFEVTNNTDNVKYITVETEVQFTGSYLNPNRRTQLHYVLEPLESRIFTPSVYIPGNYGKTQIRISLYDVVDTLDVLLPSQKFFEQPFSIRYHIPDEMLPYLTEKITLPPMVERHPDFDNEFARVMLILLNEGRTVEEIAAMAMADTLFVHEVVQSLVDKAYVRKKDGSYQVTLPVVTVSEAEEAKKLAVELSNTLAAVIENNMGRYGNVLDSLVSAGAVDKDSNTFFDGGAVLYRPYPVVSALLLWFELGQKFINRSAPLMIYNGTDLCNAYIPQYLYAVQGGDTFNGTQFYALFFGRPSYQILYGDAVPVIECGEDYILKARLGKDVDWKYTDEFLPESFMLDTTVVKPVLTALGKGADSLLVDTYYRLKDVAVKYKHEKLLYGECYWFWNLVATRTLKKLVDNGVVTRRGNGQFKFDGLQL